MATIASLDILLNAKVDSLLAGFKQANSTLDQFKKTVGHVNSALSTIGIGIGIGAIVSGFQQAVSAAEEAFQVERKLEAVLKATGNAAGFTKDQLMDYASQLSRLTGIDDEMIVSAQTMIAAFKNIRGEAFTRTTELAIDLAQHLGTSVPSAAQTLAKALSSPERGLRGLTAAGVVFTKSQRESIQAMINTGDAAAAQGVILDALAANIGGTAEKMRSGWASVRVEFGNLMEEIGKAGSSENAKGLADIFAANIRRISETISGVNKLSHEVVGLGKDVWKAFAPTPLQRFVDKVIDVQKRIVGLKDTILQRPKPNLPEADDEAEADDALTQKQLDSIEALEAAFRKQRDTFGMSANAIKLWELESDGIPPAALDAARALMDELDAMKANADEAKRLADAHDQAQKSIANIIKTLEEQNATVGMSSEALQLRQLQQLGASETELEHARTVVESTKHMSELIQTLSTLTTDDFFTEFTSDLAALKDALDAGTLSLDAYNEASKKLKEAFDTKLASEAKQVFDATRTPAEKMQQEFKKLEQLLGAGAIDWDTYQRAIAKASEEFADFQEMTGKQRVEALEFGTAGAESALNAAMDFAAAQRTQPVVPATADIPGMDGVMDRIQEGDGRVVDSVQQLLPVLRDIERNTADAGGINIGNIP